MFVTQKADDITQVEDGSKIKIQHSHLSIVKNVWIRKQGVKMLNFNFRSIFNLRYIVGFLSYKHDSKNKNDQQTLIISNLIIFLARARSFHQVTPKMTFFHIFKACSNMSRNFCARKCARTHIVSANRCACKN